MIEGLVFEKEYSIWIDLRQGVSLMEIIRDMNITLSAAKCTI
jgi:hypothetical protein